MFVFLLLTYNFLRMYTLFVGAFNKPEKDNGITDENVLEELFVAGVAPEGLCRAVAVYDVRQGEKGIEMETEKGWAVHFHDEDSCRRAAWCLKPGLRIGTYNVQLNEEAPFKSFSCCVKFPGSLKEGRLEREVFYWRDLAARVYAEYGVSLNAVLFESGDDVEILGCINPLYAADFDKWNDAVRCLAF